MASKHKAETLSGVPSASPLSDEDVYTSLLEICTKLIISEGTDEPLIHQALDVLPGLLHCEHLSGDAMVLSVRAVHILLDKFLPFLKSKSRGKLVECVRAALRRVKTVTGGPTHTPAVTFAHTKLWELQEELLQCMAAAAAQSDESVRAALPPPAQQLAFCVSVMDVSLDMCLQALRMCGVLLRSGRVNHHPGSEVALRIQRVLHDKLLALESMEVNQDWLRLLRHVTEGVVTLRAYAAATKTGAAIEPLSTPPTQKGDRKRQRSASATTLQSRRAAGGPEDVVQREGEASTWLRLCQKVCATPRLDRAFRSTVFSCASTVLSQESALHAVPASTCVAVITDLAKELSRNARTTLVITNPFISREVVPGAAGVASPSSSPADPSRGQSPFADADGEADDDADQGEDLLNNGDGVKWHTTEPEWPLLVLISTLLSAAAMPATEYMWWWVGDDDYAWRFTRNDRAQLTRAFFAGSESVQLNKRGSRVHLSTMREVQWPFVNSCRVVFQPVPCAYDVAACEAPSLQPLSAKRTHELAAALRQCDLRNLLEHLNVVTRYDGAVAQYGRTVLLTVLLAAGASADDAARSALRSFLADASTALIEKTSKALLRHDRTWATTLLEAGVTETILHRSTAATPQRSPVVRMLRREAASLSVTPPLLPKSTGVLTDPAQLRRVLQHGSREEVRDLLTSLTDDASPWNTPACVEAARRVGESAVAIRMALTETGAGGDSIVNGSSRSSASSAAWVGQLEHVLAGVVVTYLQDLALQCQPAKSLPETVGEAEIAQLELCSVGLSPAFCCPQHHPLRHHHSTNWVCNKCAAVDLDSAWSCRLCDYDLCAECARALCNRVEGAVTATAQDVLLKLRTELRPHQQHQQQQQSTETSNLLELFTEGGGLVSAATPLACLHQAPLHVAELCRSCACGKVCPGPIKASEAGAKLEANSGNTGDVLDVLLRCFGASCGQDVAVQRCLLKAYESAGTFVFLGGAGAVPPALRRLTQGLAPHLTLAVKHIVARYLAVDCRRFAFQVLHDQSAVVMSTVTGVSGSSVKNHRIQVPRNDKAAMLSILYERYRALLSPVQRVDFIFEGEEGFGSGPSQELYTELSAYFRDETKLWFVTEDDGGADPVTLAFPTTTALFLREFYVLGASCARSFIDDFRMNLDLLPESWDLLRIPSLGVVVVDGEAPCTTGRVAREALERLLAVLDPSLHRTFAQLRASPEAELAAMALEMDDGTPIATHAALDQHVEHTILTRYEVALENLRQFQWGLLSVLEVQSLDCLSNSELSAVLCGADRGGDGLLFTEDELRMQTTVGNGYSSDSPHVQMFLSIVGGELTRAQQHDFLEFLTGSPRLPFNGLAGLGRLITVAMKDMESKKELTLPSCNTCFLYLKLPPYSTRDIMKARLLFAITEGRRNYSLS